MTHFCPDKQYGFIKCDEVKDTYGLDTFLSNLILSPFEVGSTVSFPLIVNKDGKPHARLLQGHARISGDNASMARVVSDSHIDELLWRRIRIHENLVNPERRSPERPREAQRGQESSREAERG